MMFFSRNNDGLGISHTLTKKRHDSMARQIWSAVAERSGDTALDFLLDNLPPF
jgi:hypothetical protein